MTRPARRDCRVIAIANQKGGVGKTTTAVSVGACLAQMGWRVLLMDLDPQGNASTGVGIEREARGTNAYHVIADGRSIEATMAETPVPGLFVVPSTIDLAGAEVELVSQLARESRLMRAVTPARPEFGFILLDCPPSLGLLTVNALAAADELLVPIQCEYYALEGLGQLMTNAQLVRQSVNPRLKLAGILLTMFDPRVRLAEQVVDEVKRFFGALVYETIIPRAVRLAEAPGFGVPITVYDPGSKAADAYRRLSVELLERPSADLPGGRQIGDGAGATPKGTSGEVHRGEGEERLHAARGGAG